MSIAGRVMATKADILPKLSYLLKVQPLPKSLQKRLEREICRFVVGSYQGRLALHAPKEEGGLGIPRLDLWQQAMGLKRDRALRRRRDIWQEWLAPSEPLEGDATSVCHLDA